MRRAEAVLLFIGLAAPFSTAHAEEAPPSLAEIERQFRAAKLEPARAVPVRDVRLDLHLGSLSLKSGFLVPVSPVAGRTLEVVFVGDAFFELDPPDSVEARQLELFTRRRRLEEKVTAAVLVVGSDALTEKLLGRALQPLPEDRRKEAEAFRLDWLKSPVRRGPQIGSAIMQIALGDELYRSFLAAWCRSGRLGDFYCRYDPAQIEQVTVGQYVPAELGAEGEDRLRRAIKKEQRLGRFLELDPEDWGDWDSWISASPSGADGKPQPGSEGIEPSRYTLETTVYRDENGPRDALSVRGRAKLDLLAQLSGRRAVSLMLFTDLAVKDVRDGAGRTLDWRRSKGEVIVALAEPMRAGTTVSLDLAYDGVLFDIVEPGVYASRSASGWYPRCGRARYELVFKWPKSLKLVTGGRPVETGEERGVRWERRVIDVPASAISFEVGNFHVVERKVGHVDLTVAFNRGRESSLVPKDELVSLVAEALEYFEGKFGAYPLDQLTVATMPRDVSQSFLGFITLNRDLVEELPGGVFTRSPAGRRDRQILKMVEVLSHEISRQWWAHKVGWLSYRDRWLSEGLADFSAVLFTGHKLPRAPYLVEHAKEWKASLAREALNGRPMALVGPVVLGDRLDSSRSKNAYDAVVYDKGSVVFSMLAKLFGEDAFTGMLKRLADEASNRPIETTTFLEALERMSGADLQGFADQYVYAAGIPLVEYGFRLQKQENGKWRIEGDAQPIPAYHELYRLVRLEGGGWDVRREYLEDADLRYGSLAVPFRAIPKAAGAEDALTPQEYAKLVSPKFETGFGGKVILRGDKPTFKVEMDLEPLDFYLDHRGEVLARFVCRDRYPKSVLRGRAYRLLAAGKHEEAEAAFREALDTSFLGSAPPEEQIPDREARARARVEDVDIHLGLARLNADRGRDGDARNEVEIAEKLLPGLDRERLEEAMIVLESRLDLRAGNVKAAYERLRGALRLYFPQQESESTGEQLRRRKFSENPYIGTGEAYALLAVAACTTGQKAVCERAIRAAEVRDADLEALKDAQEGH